MGRRHLTRAAVAAAALTAVAASGAATAVTWGVLVKGTTVPSGRQEPVGYVAVTRAQEALWLGRLTAADRAAVKRLNLVNSAAVAIFLDGRPCASRVTVNSAVRSGPTLTVRLSYTPPPIGFATCVRTSTAYVVLAVPRRSLGRPAPTHVAVAARART